VAVTGAHGIGIAVISWDELFDSLRGSKANQFEYELQQLQAMYRVLMGGYIAPLAEDDDLHQWREREADFVILIDQVTRRLTTEHAVYPLSSEPLEGIPPNSGSMGYHRRYVCPVAGSCFSIGVRDSFAGSVTPVWMRFHKDTGNFLQIRQRISAYYRSLDFI
jgi:hypothetical protein